VTAIDALPRLVDILCDPCQDAILRDGWTIDLAPFEDGKCDFADLFTCEACYSAMDASLELYGEVATFRMLRTSDANTYNALHEAGHIRVGQALDVPVLAAYIVRRGRTRRSTGEGRTTVGDVLLDVPLIDYVTIGLAGQEANRRGLIQHGLDTRANQLDACYAASHDTVNAVTVIERADPAADVLAELQVARTRANALLDQHWDSVVDLARQLLRHGSLTFDGAHPTDHASRQPDGKVHSLG
jgi:hypothetical protein